MSTDYPRPPRTLRVTGPHPFTGSLRVPGDKSISHRALMLAALSSAPCKLRGLSSGDDVVRTGNALGALGAEFPEINFPPDRPNSDLGWSTTLHGPLQDSEQPRWMNLENSGTGIRLLAGLLSGYSFTTHLDADLHLRRRPMGRVVFPLRKMGADITHWPHSPNKLFGATNKADTEDSDEVYAPLEVTGRPLQGLDDYELPMASAQVKGALLLAGLRADGPTTVTEPIQTRTHTEEMLAAAGVRVERKGRSVTVWPTDQLQLPDMDIPGDPSQAAFWVVGACITPESELTVERVYTGAARVGYIEVLRRMGADITYLNASNNICDIRALHSSLRSTTVTAEEIPGLIDEIPILAVAAAAAEGTTVFEGAGELRFKESDRLRTTSEMLKMLDVDCRVHDDTDTLEVTGREVSPDHRPTFPDMDSHEDHRIAMAGAIAGIAGLAGKAQLHIGHFPAIETSYPGFLNDLHRCTGWSPPEDP